MNSLSVASGARVLEPLGFVIGHPQITGEILVLQVTSKLR